MEQLIGAPSRETVNPEAFRKLTVQRFLRRNHHFTPEIVDILKKDGGNFYRNNLETYSKKEEESGKASIEQIVSHERRTNSREGQTAFVVTKERESDEISVMVYKTGEDEEKELFHKVANIPVTKDDVTEETMQELDKISARIEKQVAEEETNLNKTAR